jgi:DNA-binding transcriptional MocR family regulator
MHSNTLYEQVAGRVTGLIDQGTFETGGRIPSVRKLSGQLGVSISTVMEAYRLLEDRGVIEARPQSGYYVRARFPALSEPGMSRPKCEPTPVTCAEATMRILRDTANPSLIQWGVALPNPELLPIDKLGRILAAVARGAGLEASRYDPVPGHEPLRVQIARRALRAGCVLSPGEIVTTVGSQEAINLCLRAVCRPGDTVAIESPIYYGILQAIESQGLRALEIPTHARDGLCLDALAEALDRNEVKACIVVSNFSNPLGSSIPDEKKKVLVEMLAAREIPLIEDDVYGELFFGHERPKVAKAFDTTGNVLLCSSFSKTLAPGYRVGWVAPGRFQSKIEYWKFVTNLATPTPPQMAIAAFLAGGGYDHHLRRVRRAYALQTASMAQAIGRCFPENTKVTRPSGGFVLWVELPEGVDSLELSGRALCSGITIAPGPIFSAQQKYRNFIRLNAAFWSERHEGALETLGRLAAELARGA